VACCIRCGAASAGCGSGLPQQSAPRCIVVMSCISCMVHCARLHLERGHADPLQRCARSGCASMQRAPWYAPWYASSQHAARSAPHAVRCGAVQVAEELFQAARALARIRAGTYGALICTWLLPHLPGLCRICRHSAKSAPGITGPTSATGLYVHAGAGCSTSAGRPASSPRPTLATLRHAIRPSRNI
jgi:hypothetical protein